MRHQGHIRPYAAQEPRIAVEYEWADGEPADDDGIIHHPLPIPHDGQWVLTPASGVCDVEITLSTDGAFAARNPNDALEAKNADMERAGGVMAQIDDPHIH